MGSACSTHGSEEECIQDFGGNARRKETTGKTQTWVEDNVKMRLREIGWGVVGWINLVQYRDKWRALLNTVLNLQVP
jgi:hypothetical protein